MNSENELRELNIEELNLVLGGQIWAVNNVRWCSDWIEFTNGGVTTTMYADGSISWKLSN